MIENDTLFKQAKMNCEYCIETLTSDGIAAQISNSD